MDTLIHADVFFFVTTIVVVIVGVAFTIVLIYLASALRSLRNVIDEVKEEAVLVREDIHGLRDQVQKDGWKVKYLIEAVQSIFKIKKARSSKNKN
jgi:uncharacterized protein YoxC